MNQKPAVQADTTPPTRETRSLPEPLPKVQELLNAGRVQEALQLASGRGSGGPAIRNAIAVCQMRLGKPDDAVRTLRSAFIAQGSTNFRENVPEIYRVNFATALALMGNLSGALSTLRELENPTTAEAAQLLEAIRRYEKQLSFPAWIFWKAGLSGESPLDLGEQPGTIA
ncbi:hypothetical protein SH661x_003566 [Planctomicrobium sp. SH661]|uniref:hypothetical protein n=1 Tax=Planctomicrobium sp. SH661 TaxID=3448124 RepID=UPI003F5B9993